MAFRIGRKFAYHTYPEPRGIGTGNPFARNSAIGPTDQTDVISSGNGTAVPWEFIASGAPAGTPVPITPLTTGLVRISGVLSLKNHSNDPAIPGGVQVLISVNNVLLPFPALEQNNVGISGGVTSVEVVPFLIETTALQTPIGITANVRIHVLANADNLIAIVAESSSLDLQEVSAATG